MKTNKILSILIISISLICIATNVFAAIGINTIVSNKNLGDADTKMSTIGSVILTGITNVGMILSVVIIAVLGVKYMMGSAEERADYKKSMVPYLVGSVLVFGASTIAKLAMSIGKSML